MPHLLDQYYVVGLDFETYYDDEYTLTKLSTSEYVRDERFLVHGVGIWTSWGRQQPYWFRGDAMRRMLLQIPWHECALLCHHTHFDGLILNERFGIKPAFYLDTLSMARALLSSTIGAGLDEVGEYTGHGNKMPDVLSQIKGMRQLTAKLAAILGRYCNMDVRIMWNTFWKWVQNYPEDELRIIDMTVRAFTEPVLRVNRKLCHEEIRIKTRERRELYARVAKIIGTKGFEPTRKVLASSSQFKAALEAQGIQVPMKHSPTNPEKMIPAFAKSDLAFQALAKCGNEQIEQMCKARLMSKSVQGITRANTMLKHDKPALPIYLGYCRAHTMRWGGGDNMNPQNYEACRGGNPCRLRRAIEAPANYVVVVVDSGQIEDRLNCRVSGQWDVLDEYRQPGGDPYRSLAAKIYVIDFDDVIYEQRFIGKTARLALGYGAGKDRFHHTVVAGTMGPPVQMEQDETDLVHDVYRATNQAIVNQWYTMDRLLHNLASENVDTYKLRLPTPPGSREIQPVIGVFEHEVIHMPNGLDLFYPNIYQSGTGDYRYQSSRNGWTKIWGGHGQENLIQCLARIIVGEQAIPIAERYRIVSLAHDEIVFIAHRSEAKKAVEFAIECMSTAKGWYADIPLASEGGYAKNYGDAKP